MHGPLGLSAWRDVLAEVMDELEIVKGSGKATRRIADVLPSTLRTCSSSTERQNCLDVAGLDAPWHGCGGRDQVRLGQSLERFPIGRILDFGWPTGILYVGGMNQARTACARHPMQVKSRHDRAEACRPREQRVGCLLQSRATR